METKFKPESYAFGGVTADDEPLFVLCGSDPLAPDVVRHWAEGYRLQKGIDNSKGKGPEALTDNQHEKYVEALACADAMEGFIRNGTDSSTLSIRAGWRSGSAAAMCAPGPTR